MKTYYRVPNSNVYYSLDSLTHTVILLRNDTTYKDVNKVVSVDRYTYVLNLTATFLSVTESEFETVRQEILAYINS